MLLYRLDLAQILRPDALDLGLRRHLQSNGANLLISTVMQIGQRQQAYVSLFGCAGCRDGRCAPGCRVELLRRTLRAAYGPTAAVNPCVALAQRPYQTIAVARPGPTSQPLTPAFVHRYGEARLMVHWQGERKEGIYTNSAILLTDADATRTRQDMADLGWACRVFPAHPLLFRFIGVPRPMPVPFHCSGAFSPVLLVGTPRPAQEPVLAAVEARAVASTAVTRRTAARAVVPPILVALVLPSAEAMPAEIPDALPSPDEARLHPVSLAPLVEEPAPADVVTSVAQESPQSDAAFQSEECIAPVSITPEAPAEPVPSQVEVASVQEVAPAPTPTPLQEAAPTQVAAVIPVQVDVAPAQPEALSVRANTALPTQVEITPQEALRAQAYHHVSAILEGTANLQRNSVSASTAGTAKALGASSPVRQATTVNVAAVVVPPPVPEASPFPRGPGEGRAKMLPKDVAAFVECVIAAPESSQVAEPGVNRKRISALLTEVFKEHSAALFVWLDYAGLLDEPYDDAAPYRRVRRLLTLDSATIAERLSATPVPSLQEITAARSTGMA